MAAPVAYQVDGEQFVAVLSGWGGAYPLLQGQQSAKSGNERNVSRVLVFKLGAKGDLPALPPDPKLVIDPPRDTASPATLAQGEGLYNQFCSVCHGEAAVAGGVTPDLRGSPFIAVEAWYSVVLDGALEEGGMAPFKTVLDRPKATAIRDYIVHRANEPDPARPVSGHKADPAQGAVIAAQGTAAGAPACAQCHAFTGGSDGSGAFPRIAGQSASYLSRQLRDFSSGVRSNSIMSSIARALSSDNIEDVAAYYSGAAAQFPPLANADPIIIKRGNELAEAGNSVKGIPACGACHGAEGAGESPTVPYLAGQYAHYTALQLQMWQRGFRRNSPTTMRLFANNLDDQNIAALAAYYQQLQAPSPSLARSKQ